MAKRRGDMVAARFGDRKAVKHAKRATEFGACADNKAYSATTRNGFRRRAQEEGGKAIECLEKAKTLDGGGAE